MLWKSRNRNIYVLVLWIRVGFWQEVSEDGEYGGSILSVTFSWGKFNTGLVAENQMEVLVFIYLFITKAIQGHISQSVPNWALIRGQKEKDSAVKYTGQEYREVRVFIEAIDYHPWFISEYSHVSGGSHALLNPGWQYSFKAERQHCA